MEQKLWVICLGHTAGTLKGYGVRNQEAHRALGNGGRSRSSQNPDIAKIGLTPPATPILALWWI